MQLLPGLIYPRAVVRIDDEDKSLCACVSQVSASGSFWVLFVGGSLTREVMSPQRPDLVLSAHIPDIEFDILICDGLDVEAYGGDGGDGLVELELVEDC